MKLRMKILGFISAMTVTSIIVLYVCLKMIVLSNSMEVEKQLAINNVSRIENLLAYQIETLDGLNQSWSEWDDSIEFVNRNDLKYEENNLVDTTYTSHQVELIVYMDKQGQIIYEGTYDLDARNKIEDKPEVKQYIEKNKDRLLALQPGQYERGIARIGKDCIIFSARPILSSKAEGPSQGVILMGKFFDDDEIERIGMLLKSKISILPVNSKNKSIIQYGNIGIEQISAEYQNVYLLLTDSNNEPVAILKSEIKRMVYAYGQHTLHYFLITISIICFMLCAAIVWLLDKSVLSKLQQLTERVNDIKETGDLSLRTKVFSEDELGKLGLSVNDMLASLEKSQKQLEFLSLHDQLTGLYNRASFEKEIENIKRNNIIHITIMICDVDGLKKVNDNRGHKEGDKLLINVATILKQCFREEDKIFRIGGDEFAAILNANTVEFAECVYKRIGDAISEFNSTNPEIPVGISIGFACSGKECWDVNELFKAADDLMYKEKAEHHKKE